MIEYLPTWIEVLFFISSIFIIALFYYANGKPKWVTLAIILWSIVQSVLAYQGFYLVNDTVPPRFALVLIPSTLFIIYGLLPKQREWMLKVRNTQWSTFLHLVRLPVEIVLHQLFIFEMVPELMTFEGRNFDILAGITAPIVGWLFIKNKLSKRALLYWNVVGLILVLFILANGILSAELPIQQFAFDQPNRGLNYFPFILLPAMVVPIVVWTHITDIIKLRRELGKVK